MARKPLPPSIRSESVVCSNGISLSIEAWGYPIRNRLGNTVAYDPDRQVYGVYLEAGISKPKLAGSWVDGPAIEPSDIGELASVCDALKLRRSDFSLIVNKLRKLVAEVAANTKSKE